MKEKPLYQRTKKVSEEKPLYTPFKSKAKNKIYAIYVMKDGKRKLINIGDSRYKQNYSKEARDNYLKRSKGIRDGNNNLTYNNKNTANYWARKLLWDA